MMSHIMRKIKRHLGSVGVLGCLLATAILVIGGNVASAGQLSAVADENTLPPRGATNYWTGYAVEPDYEGGSWIVDSAEKLAWIAKEANGTPRRDFSGDTIVISADIDLGDHLWEAIGPADDYPFEGNVLGNDKVISNMRAKAQSGAHPAGLFGVVRGSTITDIHLRNAEIEGIQHTGGIAAWVMEPGQISGCSVQGDLRGGNYTGGIVGQGGGVTISDCHILAGTTIEQYAADPLSVYGSVGGIAGMIRQSVVQNCSFAGDGISAANLTTTGYNAVTVGGLVGYGAAIEIRDSFFSGTLEGAVGSQSCVGGIIGKASIEDGGPSYDNVIAGCLTASGSEIKGRSSMVGGIVGCMVDTTSNLTLSQSIIDCLNNAEVTNDMAGLELDYFEVYKLTYDWSSTDTDSITDAVSGTGGILGLASCSLADANNLPLGKFTDLTIVGCVNRGRVSVENLPAFEATAVSLSNASFFAGGIVGVVLDSLTGGIADVPKEHGFNDMSIADCVNEGDISISDARTSPGGSLAATLDYYVSAGGIGGLVNYNNTHGTGWGRVGKVINSGSVAATCVYNTAAFGYIEAGGILGRAGLTSDTSHTSRNLENMRIVDSFNNGVIECHTNPANTGMQGRAGGLTGYAFSWYAGVITSSYSSLPDDEFVLTGTPFMGTLIGEWGGEASKLSHCVYNNKNGAALCGQFETSPSCDPADPDTHGWDFVSPIEDSPNSAAKATFDTWPSTDWTRAAGTVPPVLLYANQPSAILPDSPIGLLEEDETWSSGATLLPDAVVRSAGTDGYSWMPPSVDDIQTYFKTSQFAVNTAASVTAAGTAGVTSFSVQSATVGSVTAGLKLVFPGENVDPVTDPTRVVDVEFSNLPENLETGRTYDVDLTVTTNDPDALPDPPISTSWSVTPADSPLITVEKIDENKARITVGDLIPIDDADERQARGSSGLPTAEAVLKITVTQDRGTDPAWVYTREAAVTVNQTLTTEVSLTQQVVNELMAKNADLAKSLVRFQFGNSQSTAGMTLLEGWRLITDLDNLEMQIVGPDDALLPLCFANIDKDSAIIIIDFSHLNVGERALLPASYMVSLSRGDAEAIFGDSAAAVLSDPQGHLDAIFEKICIQKMIKQGELAGYTTNLVSGIAEPQQALDTGILIVDGGERLTMLLSFFMLDDSGLAFVHDGKYMIVPDGEHDRQLVDPITTNKWIAAPDTGPIGGTASGGGGGCAAGMTALAAGLGALSILGRRRQGR